MTDQTTGSEILAGTPAPDPAAAAQATPATPPAATPAATPDPAATPATPPATDAWYAKAGIEDKEVVDWLAAKNYPDHKAEIEAHRSLEKLLGSSERIAIPADPNDQAGWDKVWNRLGRPEKPEGYGFDKIEGADPDYAKYMSAALHKAGAPAGIAKAAAEAHQQYAAQQMESAKAQADAKSEAEINALKSEKGATYDEWVEGGRRVVQRDGISAEDLSALESVWGTAKMLRFFADRGKEVMEDRGPTETLKPSLTMTPDSANAEITRKLADESFMKRYLNEDPKIRAVAIQEMERLQVLKSGKKP